MPQCPSSNSPLHFLEYLSHRRHLRNKQKQADLLLYALSWQFAQGDVNSCNTGTGFGSSQGNTNSNGNSQSTYYCAATSTDGPGCQSLCKQYADGGITGQSSVQVQDLGPRRAVRLLPYP